jgi:cyclopropane-fatty-acyl-phospholipid synthase
MSTSVVVELAERGLVPLLGLRLGVRRLLSDRLREAESGMTTAEFAQTLGESRVALETEKANEQHYEVPPEFFELVLGPHLKYSSALWPEGTRDLGEAESRMLDVTCERAALKDGQDILELGCGWGSLTLHMARAYPNSRITAVSNSAPQRHYIESRAPSNVQVVTADMTAFDPDAQFDRVVSVEMFEHMRNYAELLRRIRGWLRPDGRLFVHVFCHQRFAYPFETQGADNWMGRYFFTGGIMPSRDLLPLFNRDMELEEQWTVDGRHYSETARAWRENLELRRSEVMRVFVDIYGADAGRWYHRWRLFFLACEELFGYRDGTEWMVGHYRFAPRGQA